MDLITTKARRTQRQFDAVRNVTKIVGGIVVASEEQNEKIAEVNSAVATMETMTSKNAMLVEEVAAASDSMAGQSVKLGGHVSFLNFKTDESSEKDLDNVIVENESSSHSIDEDELPRQSE